MAEKVSFKRADGSVVRFSAKKSKGKKPAKRKPAASKRTKRAASAKGAAKSCGCTGTAKAGELSALKKRVTNVENDLLGVTEGVVGVATRLGSAVSTLTRRVDAHDQALQQLGARARGMFGPGAAEPPRAPSPPPRPSPLGAGSPEPGRPRPAAPPMIPRGAGVPNRQGSLFN